MPDETEACNGAFFVKSGHLVVMSQLSCDRYHHHEWRASYRNS